MVSKVRVDYQRITSRFTAFPESSRQFMPAESSLLATFGGMANLKIHYWSLERLRPYAGNARVHSEKQITEIARSIQRFGFTNPLLVDPDGDLIAGHGRLLAADRLAMDKVPVIILTGLSDGEKKALRLADNRIAENSTWDESLLRAELQSLRDLDVSTAELGWDDAELDRMLREATRTLAAPLDEPEITPARAAQPTPPADEEDELDDMPAPTPAKLPEPKASDDDYSTFEVIMLHSNKIELIEVLTQIRAEHLYDKLEDALMHLVREHKGEPVA